MTKEFKKDDIRVDSIKDLELPEKSKRVLGEGAYASVKLVYHKKVKDWFALKQINLKKDSRSLDFKKKVRGVLLK